MREIGSEFWFQYEPSTIEENGNEINLLSGRTALKFIIDDICKTKTVKKALLPSYCCESMILPFIYSGIEVDFYNVDNKTLDYPYENDADIVLLIDFFGYTIDENITIAKQEKMAGKIVIYDSTQKINGNKDVENYADYSFCSYRKWFYCNFAKAKKHNGDFFETGNLKNNKKYIKFRDESAYEKKKFIEGFSEDKKSFLSGFAEAERLLDEDYIGYKGQPVDFDLNEISAKRSENASYLIKELKKIPHITLWKEEICDNDVPLCVPVLVEKLVRNNLKNCLISEGIYCPVHWPKTQYHKNCNDIYDKELSLICDQRYDIEDMKRIVDVIKNYFAR